MKDIKTDRIKIEDFLKNVWCIYFLYNKNELVYIGKTGFLENRLRYHKKSKNFDEFSFLKVDSEYEATKKEEELINKYKPKLNVIGSGYSFLKEDYYSFLTIDEIRKILKENEIVYLEVDGKFKLKNEFIKTFSKFAKKVKTKDKFIMKEMEKDIFIKKIHEENRKVIKSIKEKISNLKQRGISKTKILKIIGVKEYEFNRTLKEDGHLDSIKSLDIKIGVLLGLEFNKI